MSCLLFAFAKTSFAQAPHTIARDWNEVLLSSIRGDFARPTVHARNLFHTGIALYDAWAVYDPVAQPVLLGRSFGGFDVPLDAVPVPADVRAARDEAMSFAAYRLIRYRFRQSPRRDEMNRRLDSLMAAHDYDVGNRRRNYAEAGAAELGNYLGQQLIDFGNQDGSNDADDYISKFYQSFNPPLQMDEPGNPSMTDPDRWQPLALRESVDQAGNPISGAQQDFLGPEWGSVTPFALKAEDRSAYTRDGFDYLVYHDPGPPPRMREGGDESRERYQRGHEMVGIWSSLLDPSDGVEIDISPGATGRSTLLPEPEGYYDYYREFEGGDTTGGLALNPITGRPYAPNVVNRGDYLRVLAEFWADGPESETPPGHWFLVMNYVHDQPDFEPRWRGRGPILDRLEYDVKAYLTLGAAMHDAAVTAWGIKGRYDSPRPVSAIRFMAERGQRSDPDLPNYDPEGLRIEPGYIEQIENGDALGGRNGEYVGDMRIKAWRGPRYITDPESTRAGVGWIRAKEWYPYQQPTFVSPPFAGYTSGHSTFSRAAAEVLTTITGSPYFPGGLGTFRAKRDDFLVFEAGPTTDVELQWATYRDAADEVAMSRIFGGIHPPADDIPGRRIGIEIAADVLLKVGEYFDPNAPNLAGAEATPRVLTARDTGTSALTIRLEFSEPMDTVEGLAYRLPPDLPEGVLTVASERWIGTQTYALTFDVRYRNVAYPGVNLELEAYDLSGQALVVPTTSPLFDISMLTTSVLSAPEFAARASVYPNPTRDEFAIDGLGESALGGELQLVDVAGRRVRTWAVDSIDGVYSIGDLPAGLYTLALRDREHRIYNWRIVHR